MNAEARVRSRIRRFGAGVLLGAWLMIPSSASAAPATAEPSIAEGMSATEAHQAGIAAYDRGEYPQAIEYFERAYVEQGAAGDLYGWAQATRNAGDCTKAIDLYERFIDLGLGGEAQVAAAQNVERCREQLSESPPEPVVEPEPVPEPVPIADPDPDPIDAPPRRPDALAVSLLAVGGVATLAGGVLIGVGEAQRATQSEASGYERFDVLDTRIDRMHIAGGITLGVGVVMVVVGATRLAIAARRGAPAPTALRVGRGMFAVRVGLGPGRALVEPRHHAR